MKLLTPVVFFCALLGLSQGVTTAAAWDSAAYTGGNVSVLDGEVEFHWSVNLPVNDTLSFALVVPFTAKGWVGFGIGEPGSGSMPGADMLIIQYDTASMAQPSIGDYYSEGFEAPVVDCAGVNEWTLVKTTTNGTQTVFELTRPLAVDNTTYDRSIVLDLNPTNFLFAYGSGGNMSYHGTKRALAAIYLVPPISPQVTLRSMKRIKSDLLLNNGAAQVTSWVMNNYSMPQVETTYAKTPCVETPADIGTNPAYIIAMETFANPVANSKYLHHMVAKAYLNSDCTGIAVDFYAVASKHDPFTLPEGVGIRMNAYKSFHLEIHYDNPAFISGVVDHSGINIYYSYEPVVHEAGMLQLGDPAILTAEKISEGISSWHYDCPSGARQSWTNDVTVIGSFYHMHAAGYKMNYTQTAADGTIKREESVDFYQFDLQQVNYVEPYTIKKDDGLRTTCTYNNKKGNGEIKFGLDSDEEMCINFLLYYPVHQPSKNNDASGIYCGTGLYGNIATIQSHESASDLQRSFGRPCNDTTDGSTSSGAAVKNSLALLAASTMMYILTLFFVA